MIIIKFQLCVVVIICMLDFYVDTHCSDHKHLLDHTRLVQMARYLMHVADYAVVTTLTTAKWLEGSPYPNLKPMVDGLPNDSIGVPYFYLSALDFTTKNLQKDASCTVMVSIKTSIITDHCSKYNLDVEDPRCNIVLLTGKMKRITSRSSEYKFARNALTTRHPIVQFSEGSKWFIAKLKVTNVAIVDFLGRAKFVNVQDFHNYQHPGDDILLSYLVESKTKSGENKKTLQEFTWNGENNISYQSYENLTDDAPARRRRLK